MRYFVLLLDPHGRSISSSDLAIYEALPRSRELWLSWQSFAQAAALTAGDNHGDPLVVSDGDCVAAGVVRLDNRNEVEHWLGQQDNELTDLELVLRVVARHGTKYIRQILGDFAFVVWNQSTRTAVAACDPFSVKKLYYAERNGLFVFASRGEVIAVKDRYEAQYLAELVAAADLSPGFSVYAGVRLVPDGSLALLERGRLRIQRYWSVYDLVAGSASAMSEREAVQRCRELLTQSVRLRLGSNGDTWAHLSGGMDSSSIVSSAQWLAERGMIAHGLAGTVSYVDHEGTESDERIYSDAVARHWGLRNETIVDPPIWLDEEDPPPNTDQPRPNYPLYPRERRLCRILRGAGGRVLLTGVGGDELFTGQMCFFADWVTSGQLWLAVREMTRRAALGRVSLWTLAYQNVVLPLLPDAARSRLVRTGGGVPAWVPEATTRRYGLDRRTYSASLHGGRIGHKYRQAVLTGVAGLTRLTDPGIIGEVFDVRYPFLYRPLIEFAAQLPPEFCARPHQRKWVLREAMRGILPDVVRTRIGKGSPVERFAWSLTALRSLLEPLVLEPILADLGVVDPKRLRAAFDAAPHEAYSRRNDLHTSVYTTLAMEAWLQVRSGRWPRGSHRSIIPASQ